MILYQNVIKIVISRGLKWRRSSFLDRRYLCCLYLLRDTLRTLISDRHGNLLKSKSNKPTLKSIPKSPEAQFHEKTPTHTYAYYKCYLRNYNFSSNFPESDSQGFRSKFLYHEIQHHSLNQKPCLD